MGTLGPSAHLGFDPWMVEGPWCINCSLVGPCAGSCECSKGPAAVGPPGPWLQVDQAPWIVGGTLMLGWPLDPLGESCLRTLGPLALLGSGPWMMEGPFGINWSLAALLGLCVGSCECFKGPAAVGPPGPWLQVDQAPWIVGGTLMLGWLLDPFSVSCLRTSGLWHCLAQVLGW